MIMLNGMGGWDPPRDQRLCTRKAYFLALPGPKLARAIVNLHGVARVLGHGNEQKPAEVCRRVCDGQGTLGGAAEVLPPKIKLERHA